MKVLLGILVIVGLTSAELGKDPTIQEFEQEFHKLYTPEEEIEAEKNLKAHEKAIDEENELFDEGKADFQEAVMEWDDLSFEEFLAEKTGDLDGDAREFGFGLIDTPEEMRFVDRKVTSPVLKVWRLLLFWFWFWFLFLFLDLCSTSLFSHQVTLLSRGHALKSILSLV